ncbi:LysR family transcriptional regulator [Xylophilus sp. ASV27]|uniref:LysR family transcriptional regulator n=1 Tax=Xylophilus sp. ASV27 TaxID=2795129 RepID=UPI0018EB78E2|nr:LysR family transcriptional regulator [Xylophilus sp. ASV27]
MSLTITLRHLQHFRVAASTQNFHRAAEEIPTDISSLSRTIDELETRLRVKLFVRGSHGVRLTPAGLRLQARCNDMLANFREVVREVQEAYAEGHLPLRVGIADGLAQPLLSMRLAQWRAAHPAAELDITEMRASELAAGLRHEELDVGFSFGVKPEQAIVQEAAWSYPLVVLVPSGHVLAGQPSATMPEVVSHPLVVCDPHYKPGVHRQIDALIRQHTHKPIIASHACSLAGFITKIGSGCGIGLADAGHMLTMKRPDVVSIPLRDAAAELTTYVLYRRRKAELPATLEHFVAHARAQRIKDGPA